MPKRKVGSQRVTHPVQLQAEKHIFEPAVMIAFVRGDFAVKTPAQVVVDVNGVGYDLHISLNTYEAISNKEKGRLYTYLHITENAHVLYGFAVLKEKGLIGRS